VSTRQQIGLRKSHSTMHQRGVERRQALLQAARELLEVHDIEAVSFRDIAARAGVPEGSAYHFYANRFDLFSALAAELSEEFIKAHRKPVPAAKLKSWQTLAEHLVDVGARIYKASAPARQLLIGAKTPAEVKQADRMNDQQVSAVMYEVFSRYFVIPDTAEMRAAFYYFIEITDLMFMLSLIENDKITRAMTAEAKRAGVSYLGSYFLKPPDRA
jgi:AcrR family transcriptional regulator